MVLCLKSVVDVQPRNLKENLLECFSQVATSEFHYLKPFKVQGQVYHRILFPQPLTNEEQQFLQTYFVGNFQEQASRFYFISPDTKLEPTPNLHLMIYWCHSYVKSFKCAQESSPTHNFNGFIDVEKRYTGQHPGRFNEPSVQ